MKQYTSEVLISGAVDSSLERSIGISVQELDKLKRAFGEISNIAASANAKSNGLVEPEGFKQAAAHAKQIESSFTSMDGIMAGMFGATALGAMQTFFASAVDGAGKLANLMKESSNAAATLEGQKTLFGISMQMDPEAVNKEVERVRAQGLNNPYTTPAELIAEKRLGEPSPATDPALKLAYAQKQFGKASDIAAYAHGAIEGGNGNYDDELKIVASTISEAEMQGYITKASIAPLEKAGINVRAIMLDQSGMLKNSSGEKISRDEFAKMPQQDQDVIYGQLAKAIKGRKEFAYVFDRAIDEATGPGGIAYGAAARMSNTTEGRENTFKDNFITLQTLIGDVENKILSPLLNEVNTGFVSHLPEIEKFFNELGKGVDKSVMPVIEQMMKDSGDLANTIGKSFDQGMMNSVIYDLQIMTLAMDAVVKFLNTIGNVWNAMPGWMKNLGPGGVLLNSDPTGANAKIQSDAASGIHSGGSSIWTGYSHSQIHSVIPGHADGGIFNTPHVGMVGEAGTEAVLPLSTFQQVADTMRELADTERDLIDAMRNNGGFGGGPGGNGSDGMLGGVKLTEYGYAGDSTGDSNSRNGIGDRDNRLQAGLSVALTRSMRQRLFGTSGGSTGRTFEYGGRTYRDNDTAPESGLSIDRNKPNHASDKGSVNNTFNIQSEPR